MEREITVTYESLIEGEGEKRIYIWKKENNTLKVLISLTPAEANELQINLESLLVVVGKELLDEQYKFDSVHSEPSRQR